MTRPINSPVMLYANRRPGDVIGTLELRGSWLPRLGLGRAPRSSLTGKPLTLSGKSSPICWVSTASASSGCNELPYLANPARSSLALWLNSLISWI